MNIGEDSVMKVFNKIKLNGIEDNINLGGDYAYSSDRLLVSTNTGLISTGNLTYVASSTGHSEYKISGSNKKGRWIQFKLENMTESVDSIGVLFRRKRPK